MPSLPYITTFICMEPSRPAVVAEAVDRINRSDLGVHVTLHTHLSSELDRPDRHDAIARHLAESDLVVFSHIFLDEEVAPLEALLAHLSPSATILPLSCAASLMRRTRIGRFSMKARSPRVDDSDEPIDQKRGEATLRTLLRRIVGGRDITPYLKELMILAPSLLRLMPGKMGDVRCYLLAYLYVLEPSVENLASMFLMLADRYHEPLRGTLRESYAPPVVHPDLGIYHPDAPELFTSYTAYRRWRARATKNDRPQVGLLLLRSDLIAGDRALVDHVVRAFERRGIDVVPAFAGSLDCRAAVERMMHEEGRIVVDALVSLTGFPLVGGHVRSDAASAADALARYDVPFFSPITLLFQNLEEWADSDVGVSPVQSALQVALPELDGAAEPLVIGGIAQSGKRKQGIPSRIERLVDRVERRVALRTKEKRSKRIAVTIFAFPPNRGAVGTAAYLDVFRSLHSLLLRLRDEGYDVDVPASPEAIIDDLVPDGTLDSIASSELHVADRLDLESYRRLAPHSERATQIWGPAPGTIDTDGRTLSIHGRRYGNVFVGVQPSFGYDGDPMRLLFARGATPHHGFIAYYTWIAHVFAADAHLHFGTHGALEFMPGKQVGLSDECWPDLLIGSIPNIYLYAINNPSEGTIAKRRSNASLVSYLTPPLENAGLYRELSSLKEMIYSWRTLPAHDARRRLTLEALVEKALDLHLGPDAGIDAEAIDRMPEEELVTRVESRLAEIEERLIPTGLHVAGEAPASEELADLLLAVAEYDRPEHGVRSLLETIASAWGEKYHELYRRAESGDGEALARHREARRIARLAIERTIEERSASESARKRASTVAREIAREMSPATIDARQLRRALEYLHDIAGRATERHELDALVAALDGGYTRPGLGSDPVRAPHSLPSGRNIHSLDPTAIPSPMAIRNARRVVEMMLKKAHAETGTYPKSIGMILWGLDTIKTGGESVAQAFALIGVEPRPNSIGRVTTLRVIPLEELERPRVDVTLETSGIFRDIFGLQIDLLDEAIRMVSTLDEPEEMNHVKRRTREIAERFDIPIAEASARLFSNAAGSYGTNIDHMVSSSAWSERSELAELFARRKSFLYRRRSSPRQERALLEALAGGIDTTFQNLDSSEVGITDVDHYFEYLGGFTSLVERRSGKRPLALVADTTTSRGTVRTLEATIRLEARTKLLNPKWFEGMLSHGYQGVEEIRKRLDYTFGFSATAGAVDEWIYQTAHDTYVADAEIRERMRELNIHAYASLVGRLAEAAHRGYWSPDEATLERMKEMSMEMEDRMEGI